MDDEEEDDIITCDKCRLQIKTDGYYAKAWATAYACIDEEDCDYDICHTCYEALPV